MPKSLWDADSRRELVDRLNRVQPNAIPLWGKMNAAQMMAHLTGWMKMANGELKTTIKPKGPFRHPPLKQFIIYWAPWPKGVPTAPELISREKCDFAGERASFCRYMEAYETRPDPRATWPEHPAFGNMTTREWGVLGYRHTDHHLRQFGV